MSQKPSPVLASMDHNEAARSRGHKLAEAIQADEHFQLDPPGDCPFDLKFTGQSNTCEESTMHIELKDFTGDDNSDYLSSILNGHLWEQVLAARELQQPFALVVLGDDNDVGAAIRAAANRKHKMDVEKLMEYYRMVEGFEANCIALGAHVWRLKTDPYKRLLLRVRKILEGGNLDGFIPKPAPGERQAVALSILAGRGVGPKKACAILEKFDINLLPKDNGSYGYYLPTLEDVPGIGPKLADQIRKNVVVVDDQRLELRRQT